MMNEMEALWLTLRLAAIVTALLLCLGLPLAWWLANSRSRLKPVIEALTALPLVLPPTVLGFYLLILFNPQSPFGSFWLEVSGHSLSFSFSGLVVASCLYSLPFMVQPLQAGFETVTSHSLEAAASLRAGPWDRFFHVALPASKRALLTAMILTFAHTLGEFGVVLMVGGNIPGKTQTLAISIYEQVETLNYAQAHTLSAMLLLISFSVLVFVYIFNRREVVHVG